MNGCPECGYDHDDETTLCTPCDDYAVGLRTTAPYHSETPSRSPAHHDAAPKFSPTRDWKG